MSIITLYSEVNHVCGVLVLIGTCKAVKCSSSAVLMDLSAMIAPIAPSGTPGADTTWIEPSLEHS